MTEEPGIPIERYLERSDWVRALARNLVGEGEADDLVQEAWLLLLAKGPRRPESFGAWMRAVLRGRSKDLRRSDRRRREREELAAVGPRPEPCPSEAAERLETHRRVVEAILSLPEPYLSVVVDRYFEGRPTAEIALREVVAESSVRARLSRALSKLREELDRDFGRGRARLAGLVGLCALGWPEGGFAAGVSNAAGGTAAGAGLVGWGLAVKKAAAAIALLMCIGLGVWRFGGGEGALPSEPTAVARSATERPPDPEPAAAVTRSTHSRSGTVLDARTLSPLAGATVSLDRGDDAHPFRPLETLGSVRSGADGAFLVRGDLSATSGVFRLRVECEGYEPRFMGVKPERDALDGVEIRLDPGHEISGVVLLPGGAPASDGEVFLFGGGLSGNRWEYTELGAPIAADGSFRTWLAADVVSALAAVPGCAPGLPEEHWHGDGRWTGLVLRALPGHSGSGVVLDPAGVPVAGARIEFPSWGFSEGYIEPFVGALSRTVTTDASGGFSISGFAEVAKWVEIEHPEYRSPDLEIVAIEEGMVFVLEQPRWITCDFVDEAGSAVAPPAVLIAFAGNGTRAEGLVTAGRTRFAVPSEDGEAGRLFVRDCLHVDLHWSASDPAPDLGTIRLERGASLVLRVTDPGGVPIPEVALGVAAESEVWREKVRTDAAGTWRSSGFSPGTTRLVGEHLGTTFYEEIEIAEGENAHEIVVDAGAIPGAGGGARVRGRVEPVIPGGFDVAIVAGGVRVETGRGEAGEFSLPAPAGHELQVELAALGRERVVLTVSALAVGEERDLSTAQWGPSSLGRIEGRIRDDAGGAIPHVRIGLHSTDSGWEPLLETLGDRQGEFSFDAPPGVHELRIHPPAGVLPPSRPIPAVAVESGQAARVEIELERGTTLETRLIFDDGRAGIDDRWQRVGLATEDGSWSIRPTIGPDGRVRAPAVPDRPLVLNVARFFWSPATELRVGPLLPDRFPAEIRIPRGGEVLLDVPGVPERAHLELEWTERDGGVAALGAQVLYGRALLYDVRPGPTEIRVTSLEYTAPPLRIEVVAGERVTAQLAIERIVGSEPLEVTVTDRAGAPIPGASVMTFEGDRERFSITARATLPDGSGSIEVVREATQRWLGIRASGFATRLVELPERVLSPFVVALDPGSSIRAIGVRPDGSIDPELRLQLRLVDAGWQDRGWWRALEQQFPYIEGDSRVRYLDRITDLPAGRYEAQLLRTHRTLVAAEIVAVGTGESLEVRVEIPEPFVVHGRVTLDGVPARRGRIQPDRWTGLHVATLDGVEISRDGTFELELCVPGLYWIRGYDPDGEDPALRALSRWAPVVELSGERTLELAFESACASIRFLDPDGVPLAGVSGRFSQTGLVSAFTTSETGVAAIEGLLPGDAHWQFDLQAEGMQTRGVVELPAEATELEVRLAETVRERLSVRGGDGEPIRVRLHLDGHWVWLDPIQEGEIELAVPTRATAMMLDCGRSVALRALPLPAAPRPFAIELSDMPSLDVRVIRSAMGAVTIEARPIGGPALPAWRGVSRSWVDRNWFRLDPGRYLVVATDSRGVSRSQEVELRAGHESILLDLGE